MNTSNISVKNIQEMITYLKDENRENRGTNIQKYEMLKLAETI